MSAENQEPREKKQEDPQIQFARKMASHLQKMFDDTEETEDFIDLTEVAENDTMTELFHAMANIVPALFYQRFTGTPVDGLEFNHIANRLCFQFSKTVDNEEEQPEKSNV